MKRVVKLFVAAIILLLFVQVGWNLYNNRSILDISSWSEKCIFCNFENRHHCNLCMFGKRQCLFCDTTQNMGKKRNNE